MKLTIVGCGDAFGSGGRLNTCFWLETAKATMAVDFGASSLVALKKAGLDPNALDGIVLSHLHGDHFGALPLLLLDYQFLSRRERPFLIAGPTGSRTRIDALMEAFFPKSTGSKWKFAWEVQEIVPGVADVVLGHTIATAEVIHQSGTPSTALRLSDGKTTFAYSGDTEWTDALLPIARGADLFICECYTFDKVVRAHLSLSTLRGKLPIIGAKRVILTHMSDDMLSRASETEFETASDGKMISL
jgi:ribonuclease BN (tRNA processing enzyme)